MRADDDGRIVSTENRDGHPLAFIAGDLRRERTGPHATVSILYGDEIEGNVKLLASDVFNVGRDRDRTHLANSAWKQLPDVAKRAWPQADVKHSLDRFTAGLWGEYVKTQSGELMAGDPDVGPPRQLIGAYVVEGGGTLLYAPPGRGKSYIALAMAISLDAGVDAVWPVREAKRTAYVNIERSTPSVKHRLASVNRALGLDPRRPLPFLNARGRSLADVADGVAEMIRRYEIEVVFLDSISRAGMGDLTDGAVANKVIDVLNRLCQTWLAIAHTPRAAEDHVYGSVFFTAGADVEVRLSSQTGERVTGVGLEVTKANDVAKPPLATFARVWGPDGLEAIRSARRHEFPELEAGRPTSLAEEVAEYLAGVGKDHATSIANALGRNRQAISTLLNHDQRFVLVERSGRVAYYGVKTTGLDDTSLASAPTHGATDGR